MGAEEPTGGSHLLLISQSRSSIPRAALAADPAVTFSKRLRVLLTNRGLGALPGNPKRVVSIASWNDAQAALHWADEHDGDNDWWLLMEVLSTRGSHGGAKPLRPRGGDLEPGQQLAVLTLGRTTLARLPRFLTRGAMVAREIEQDDAVSFAASAGWPITGNMTLSLWDSEEQMLERIYRGGGSHPATVRAKRPILRDQLNARLAVIASGGVKQAP